MPFTRCILLVLLLFVLLPIMNAQKIFKKGSVLTKGGQRLDGFLYQQYLSPDADTLFFKAKKNDTLIAKYTPFDLLAYRLAKDRYYVAAEVPRLAKFKLPSTSTERVFLQQLNDGALPLFLYKTKQQEHLYLRTQSGMYQLLSFEKTPLPDTAPASDYFFTPVGIKLLRPVATESVTDRQGDKYINTDRLYLLNRQYISALRKAMQACASLQISPRLPLERKTIQPLVEKYHNCAAPAAYERLNKKPWFQVSLLSYLGYNAVQYGFYESLEYGLLLDIRENSWSPHVSLTLGLGRYTESVRTTDLFIEETEIAVVTGRLNYNFLAGRNVRPYLFFGVRYFQFDTLFYRNGVGGITSRDSFRDIFSENAGAGLSWYFLNINHLRLEVGYTGAVEGQLAYGILLVK